MNIYEQQESNRRTTMVLLGAFLLLFLAVGAGFDFFYLSFNPVAGEPSYKLNAAGYYEVHNARPQMIPYGTIGALLFGLVMVLNSVFNGPGMVLRSTMARRAVSTDPAEKQFINVVKEMSIASGVPMPQTYVVPDQDANAFATGFSYDNAVIAVTEGLLKNLNREELQAVVAHEMSHIRNYDMRVMTVAAALMGAISLISDFAGRSSRYGGRARVRSSGGGRSGKGGGAAVLILFVVWLFLVVVAPLLSRMLAMAISRQREFLADASAAELTRNPMGLVSALEKIRASVQPTNSVNNGVAHMCITDPRGSLIEEKSGFAADLLATHPPMEKRILALKMMAYQKAPAGA
ncbi:MAG: M48 family metallopeptidase [Elusimicrobiales bacterium]|jgi:heat shock protein HtpX|nr:M48 family metallopeptidase [Elusimicrobiales bacterium]